jgi:uncharacterized membrane protein YfcA
MTALDFGLLVLAGIGAGLVGSVAGLASLISYPALLTAGVPPLTANMTNTVAMVFQGVGSVSASRPELRGQGRRAFRLAAASALGGAVGAALLLLTPTSAFERIVPVLIAAASAAILVQRPPRELAVEGALHHPTHRDPRWLPLATFAIAIYGGYFGAAAGVMLLAMLLLTTGEGLPRGNAMRNVVLGLANAVAAIAFIVLAPIAWWAALPLAIGLFTGSRCGPWVVRRVPQAALRRVIAVAGLALAVHLGIEEDEGTDAQQQPGRGQAVEQVGGRLHPRRTDDGVARPLADHPHLVGQQDARRAEHAQAQHGEGQREPVLEGVRRPGQEQHGDDAEQQPHQAAGHGCPGTHHGQGPAPGHPRLGTNRHRRRALHPRDEVTVRARLVLARPVLTRRLRRAGDHGRVRAGPDDRDLGGTRARGRASASFTHR